MTDKKQKILNISLELFANEGYANTSTSKIAKKAGVSEGLIFRHFKNKQGLLDAITIELENKLREIISPILFENDAKKVIKMYIELPFLVPENEYDFWRLQFKLKWETEYKKNDKMDILIDKLATCFERLNYNNPKHEAKQLYFIIDALSIEILRNSKENLIDFKNFLIEKYK